MRFTLEALIGLLFVLAVSTGMLLVSLAPHSDELSHDLLVGQILWVGNEQLLWVLALYALLLVAWFSLNNKPRPLLFYLIFSLAVTASVQLVGIYLVFASLILPALVTRSITSQKHALLFAYRLGICGYIVGLIASIFLDIPTGVVTVWSLLLVTLCVKPFLRKSLNIV